MSTRTRLRLTPAELTTLRAMIEHMTVLRNRDLPAAAAGRSRNDRRKALEGVAPTRVLDTMTADTNAMVATRRENLKAERTQLRAAIAALRRRVWVTTKDLCSHPHVEPDPMTGLRVPTRGKPCKDCRDGYPTRRIRHAKQQRAQVLTARLASVEKDLTGRTYRLTPGGRRRLNTRLHLETAGLTEQEWRDEGATARAWCACSGSTGEHRGNRVFTLDPETGRLSVTVPKPVADAHGLGPVRAWAAGYVLTLTTPVSFVVHGVELAERLGENFGVRFDLEPVYRAGKVIRAYLRASWTREHLPPLPTLDTARDAGLLVVDLNADHFAAARIDASGNPVGATATIPLVQAGPKGLRDARLREAITALLDLAEKVGAATMVVEDLNFTDPTTRERGHGRRVKAFRKTVAGIPTAQVRSRQTAMAARRGITVVCVDPRYTSQAGGKAWAAYLNRRRSITTTAIATSTIPVADPRSAAPMNVVTVHHGAAVAIARRGLGLRLTPRPARPAPHSRDGNSPARRQKAADRTGAVTPAGRRSTPPRRGQHDPHPVPGPAPTFAPASAGPQCGPAAPARGVPGGDHEYVPDGHAPARPENGERDGTGPSIGPIHPAC